MGSGSGFGSGSGSGSGLGSRVLFPFGTAAGDLLFVGDLDDSSDPLSKVDFGGLTCPFFGTNESILHVSGYLHNAPGVYFLSSTSCPLALLR